MRLAEELIDLPVYTIADGQEMGRVEDLYLDDVLKNVTAIYLGGNGILNRPSAIIRHSDVITLGVDAIMIQDADRVLDEEQTSEISEWTKRWRRRDDLKGHEIETPGGTKIGQLGDIILDKEANIVGFTLSQTYVTGQVADNKAINRSAMVEPGDGRGDGQEDSPITFKLAEAERSDLKVEEDTLFSFMSTILPGGNAKEMKTNE